MHNYIHFYSDRYPGEIPKYYNSILTLIWTLWFSILVAWLPANLSSRGRRWTTLADEVPKCMRTNPMAQLCRRRQGLRIFFKIFFAPCDIFLCFTVQDGTNQWTVPVGGAALKRNPHLCTHKLEMVETKQVCTGKQYSETPNSTW